MDGAIRDVMVSKGRLAHASFIVATLTFVGLVVWAGGAGEMLDWVSDQPESSTMTPAEAGESPRTPGITLASLDVTQLGSYAIMPGDQEVAEDGTFGLDEGDRTIHLDTTVDPNRTNAALLLQDGDGSERLFLLHDEFLAITIPADGAGNETTAEVYLMDHFTDLLFRTDGCDVVFEDREATMGVTLLDPGDQARATLQGPETCDGALLSLTHLGIDWSYATQG